MVKMAMKAAKTFMTVVVVSGLFIGMLSGCKRKQRTYAGIDAPAPVATIDPHK